MFIFFLFKVTLKITEFFVAIPITYYMDSKAKLSLNLKVDRIECFFFILTQPF